MPSLRFEPWLLNEQNAKALGLPVAALIPAAQLAVDGQESVWFDSEASMAIWQGSDFQHGFPAGSMDEALDRIHRLDVG